jgi:hypothetical protein
MTRMRRHNAKRNRQIKKWLREFRQLDELFSGDYFEAFTLKNSNRRWYLMEKLGLR